MADTKLKIKVDDVDVTLFMSFGLLEALLAKLEADQVEIFEVPLQSKLRVPYLQLLLKSRPKFPDFGLATDFDPDANEISQEDVGAVFEWASEHVASFFVSKAKAMEKLVAMFPAPVAPPSATSSVSGS